MITDDVDRLIEFDENVTLVPAVRYTPALPRFGSRLRSGHTQTAQPLGPSSADATHNHSMIVEFLVDDVDAEHERLRVLDFDWALTETTMPWANRSTLLRDPDGNLVNLFAPGTEDAAARPNTPNRVASGGGE
jgi:catechol 2,3-dioxygenase-like lactoylglutathione lyase family enzyme